MAKKLKIVILGCGRVGSTLASTLSKEGHDVTIIDRNADQFRRLEENFSGNTVVGNGIDFELLKKAGVEKADVFVTTTNGDNTSIMASQIASHRFKVPKVLTRIYDPKRANAYQELGLQTVCPTEIISGILKEKILS